MCFGLGLHWVKLSTCEITQTSSLCYVLCFVFRVSCCVLCCVLCYPNYQLPTTNSLCMSSKNSRMLRNNGVSIILKMLPAEYTLKPVQYKRYSNLFNTEINSKDKWTIQDWNTPVPNQIPVQLSHNDIQYSSIWISNIRNVFYHH